MRVSKNKVIYLKDNSSKSILVTQECEDIRLLANQTIKDLVHNNPGLLVYPQCLNDCNDYLKKQYILSEYESVDSTQRRIMHISTGNIIGFIGSANTNISICSRFTENSEPHKDFFLHYMLQKVLSINLFNLNHSFSTEDQVFNFLLLLFPTFLKEAVAQGIYKKYVSRQRNDANIRGTIDISRHINHNIPFNGRVAYKSREICYDNNVTELIRHCIEYISSTDFGKAILSIDKETIEAINQIKTATSSYSRNNRSAVIHSNSRLVNHPFYTKYRDLQKLCIRILEHQKLKYGENDHKISGIMFDASWLWEEYMAILLPSFEHPQNRKGSGMIYLAKNNFFQRYPDFYKGKIGGVVLDAKYKHNIDRDDEHQIISYMYRLQSKVGGFLLPSDSETSPKSFSMLGYGNDMQIHYLEIPQNAQTFSDFSKQIRKNEDKFITELNQV